MRPHGKNVFQEKIYITKNKERPIIDLRELFPTVLTVHKIKQQFARKGLWKTRVFLV